VARKLLSGQPLASAARWRPPESGRPQSFAVTFWVSVDKAGRGVYSCESFDISQEDGRCRISGPVGFSEFEPEEETWESGSRSTRA